MDYIELEAGSLASVSIDGVEYKAEDGRIAVPSIHVAHLLERGLTVAPPAEDDGKPDADEDPPVLLDGVEADREALVSYLTAAGQKPSPNAGDKTLRARARKILASLQV